MATMTSSNALASEKTDDKHAYWTTSEAAGFNHGPYQQFTLPTMPPPTLQLHSQSPTLRSATLTPSDSANTLTPDPALLYDNSTLPYKDLSLSSSASTSFAMTPVSSNELEKSSVSTKDSDNTKRNSLRKSSSNARDPEKGHHAPSSRRTSSTPQRPRRTVDPHLTSTHLRYSVNSYASEDPQRRIYEASAGRILLFLSLPCVVLSLLNAMWTLIAVFITLLTQPVRLCARRPTFGQQLGGLVGPALNLHLRCIYTPLPPHADEDCSWRSGALVATQMLSPLLAFGMMVAAWVVAVFWLTSAMIGDPAGKGGEHDDDGRDTVLALRNWWERWLARSMIE